MKYKDFFDKMADSLGQYGQYLSAETQKAFEQMQHGHFDQWRQILESLPHIEPSICQLDSDAIKIGSPDDCSRETRNELEALLRQFHPWRKGPFEIFGIFIDTEWRSDIKWNRLAGSIAPLEGRRVLDVGCGNGYHCMRAAGAGADIVVGIDPFLLYVMQFQALNSYLGLDNVSVLPLGVEAIPSNCGCFDTVFSMGVLYHRKDPVEHIRELGGFLDDHGQLVLETLIIEDPRQTSLTPGGRYGKMRNVGTIPGSKLLLSWLEEAGFSNAGIVDISKTTSREQRKTDWMTFESLEDFLDPNDSDKTIEGHPAPIRAVVLAQK